MNHSLQWEEVARRGRNHALLSMDLVAEAFQGHAVSKAMGMDFDFVGFRQFDGARWLYKKDCDTFIQLLKKYEAKDPGYLLKKAKEYQQTILDWRAYGDAQQGTPWEGLGTADLVKAFNGYTEKVEATFGMVYNYIFLNRFLPEDISAEVCQKEKSIEKQNRIFHDLFLIDRLSETAEEKMQLLTIAKKISVGALKQDGQDYQKHLSDHVKKYAHLRLYVFYGKPYTTEDIHARIQQVLQKNTIEKELNELLAYQQARQHANAHIERLGMDQETILKIEAAREWMWGANLWDETFIYNFHHNFYGLFETIAKTFGVPVSDVIEMRAEEIRTVLQQNRKLNAQEQADLKERYQDSALLLQEGKIRVLIKEELTAYYKKEKAAEEDFGTITELRGQPASPGFVRGTVKVTRSILEVKKVQKGDILVAPATTPAHVPAMEKAAAIVTDEGGLLCHAAIVSRELKIPCVVGTKIATKVLKDGDTVEVNAEKGIVTILHKYSHDK